MVFLKHSCGYLSLSVSVLEKLGRIVEVERTHNFLLDHEVRW